MTSGFGNKNVKQRRLVIVSNRLPFTAGEQQNGKLSFKESTGGVASGLNSYLSPLQAAGEREYIWVGWPGSTINSEDTRRQLRQEAQSRYQSYPVFLSEAEMENFYHGFCNKVIWPLFHYFPSYAGNSAEYWEHYKQVNQSFCDALLEIAKPDDEIWIHDYHLMLLPDMLRQKLPRASIGFFLHIPFPAYELLQLMPDTWRTELLKGLLGADLVGFHTYGYTHNFLRSILLTFGYDHKLGLIQAPRHLTKADTFPMGIDFDAFQATAASDRVADMRGELAQRVAQKKVVLSIDRLDYTKGIINRLEAFEMFLDRYPEWRGRVVMALVIVPSRVAVEHYKQTRSRIEGLVGHINGRFGDMVWTPVSYQYRSLDFENLVAMYAVADVALVTPLRDGMNLIAKEYVASQDRVDESSGVLILSETAGAASELVEAIIINPNSRSEIAEAIKNALEMPVPERLRRNAAMQQRLRAYDIRSWAADFLGRLRKVNQEQAALTAGTLSAADHQRIISGYHDARQRLIFLDYDGTLTGYEKDPASAAPSRKLLEVLSLLSQQPGTDVVLISGRDKQTLERWFGNLNIEMVAEHGVWARKRPGGLGGWTALQSVTTGPGAWKSIIRPILDLYSDRLPGSLVEEKDFSLAWHYRGADPEFASVRTRELLDYLLGFTMNRGVQVLMGNKVVEIRQAGVNKGAAARRWLEDPAHRYDFILAAGDDRTDEELFQVMPDTSWSIRVAGDGDVARSAAHSRLESHEALLALLDELAEWSPASALAAS